MLLSMKRLIAALAGLALLGACSVTPPPALAPPDVPAAWYAPPLPHQGSTAQLAAWWSHIDDPVLSDWLARAQAQSPSVAAARAQVFAARTQRLGVQVQTGPQAALALGLSRAQNEARQPAASLVGAGLQVSWVIDLWGGKQAQRERAAAQQEAAHANWHQARVLVAAELAQLYFAQRMCREQLALAAHERDSRALTERSSDLSARAGLSSAATSALERAASAHSAVRWAQQAEQCERQIKSLVALTGVPEPQLRRQLQTAPELQELLASDRLEHLLAVQAVPADVIRQRPDVYRAQHELLAAGAAVGVARALLKPNLSFSGQLLRNHRSSAGLEQSFNTWAIGPLSLSLPLIGREALHAGTDSAQAQYQAAALTYAATLRQAVAEVEQSLLALASLRERGAANARALAAYNEALHAAQARWRAGLANLAELEQARRLQLSAHSSVLALQQERINAWIDLYVALGGGFDPSESPIAPTS
ncbi:MAG: efflux transporter outer membrane subunit [Hydrogenophaga sp.]|nr:efflux transporter outer membrane subunit [Hydrogenophaga sp.]